MMQGLTKEQIEETAVRLAHENNHLKLRNNDDEARIKRLQTCIQKLEREIADLEKKMGAKAKYSRPRVAIDPEVCLPRAPNSSAENFLSGFFTHPTHLRAALNGAGRNGERREEEGEKMGVK